MKKFKNNSKTQHKKAAGRDYFFDKCRRFMALKEKIKEERKNK